MLAACRSFREQSLEQPPRIVSIAKHEARRGGHLQIAAIDQGLA
jgi:hypothetical protein